MLREKKTEIFMARWVIFQFGSVIKVAGIDIETKKFRISSNIEHLVNELDCNQTGGITSRCVLQSSSGTKYVVVGFPCNLINVPIIRTKIDQHVKKRFPTGIWVDVSYLADTTFFDGDFV